jgi:glycosyltransferase involved in cell wall biosynthesis
MNVLIVSYYQIYPLKVGASIAQFGVIEYLSQWCNISLVIAEHFTPTEQELTELQNLLPTIKIYTFKKPINSNLNVKKPEAKTESFIKNLKILKKKILGQETKKPVIKISPEEELIKTYSSNPFFLWQKQYASKIIEIISKDNIDIVQLEFNENLSLVTLLPEQVKKIFVEHECRFARIESHLKAKNIKSVFGDYMYNFYKCIELALLEKFDGIITFSESDRDLLKNSLQTKNDCIEILNSPFPILERDFQPIERNNFHHPTKLVFVGPEKHFPNKDAVEWFLEEAAVDILKKFGLKLYIVGEWSLETMKKYEAHPSQVQFTGFVEDLYTVTKDSISIAPVRIGGGLRTKILLAMAQGTPVICTTFALEGINATHQESIMIADDKDMFCSAVEYLVADLNRTFAICQKAQSLVKNNYSQSVVSELRYKFYQKILGASS